MALLSAASPKIYVAEKNGPAYVEEDGRAIMMIMPRKLDTEGDRKVLSWLRAS